ncbi:MAG: SMP-30/gluconolactonase/LRE family protein [Planctomycetota bacterium]
MTQPADTLTSRPLRIASAALGEGPVWHEGALWFVDIEGRSLHRADTATTTRTDYDAGARIGFAAPTARGDWIVGLQHGLHAWSPGSGTPVLLTDPEPHRPDNRFNDGKADPTGRLYAGTLHIPCQEPAAALYRLDAGATTARLRTGVTISNGLAWDAQARTMYYTDTPTGRIDAYRWDPDTGDITERRTAFRFTDSQGSPDGMTIDRDGQLWIALWGGGAVVRLCPREQRITAHIAVDAPHVTSCTFGPEPALPDSDTLGTLYITTARTGLDGSALQRHPRSGDIFVADVRKKTGATGSPATPVSIGLDLGRSGAVSSRPR